MNKSRARTWLFAIITALITAACNVTIAAFTGIEVASFTMFFLVPVGSLLLCALASSGFYLGAKTSSFPAGPVDLVFLMLVNVGMLFLVYGVEYMYALWLLDIPSSRLGSLAHFIASDVTERKYNTYFRGMPSNAPPVAAREAGWMLLAIRVSGALAVAKIIHSRFDRRETEKWSSQ